MMIPSFVIQGIHFVIARNLYEKAKPIDIDFVEYTPGAGFKITLRFVSQFKLLLLMRIKQGARVAPCCFTGYYG